MIGLFIGFQVFINYLFNTLPTPPLSDLLVTGNLWLGGFVDLPYGFRRVNPILFVISVMGIMGIPFHYVKEHQVIIRKTNLVLFSCCTPLLYPLLSPRAPFPLIPLIPPLSSPFHTPFLIPFHTINRTQKNTETPPSAMKLRAGILTSHCIALASIQCLSPTFPRYFPKIHHLCDKRILRKGRMRLHQLFKVTASGSTPNFQPPPYRHKWQCSQNYWDGGRCGVPKRSTNIHARPNREGTRHARLAINKRTRNIKMLEEKSHSFIVKMKILPLASRLSINSRFVVLANLAIATETESVHTRLTKSAEAHSSSLHPQINASTSKSRQFLCASSFRYLRLNAAHQTQMESSSRYSKVCRDFVPPPRVYGGNPFSKQILIHGLRHYLGCTLHPIIRATIKHIGSSRNSDLSK